MKQLIIIPFLICLALILFGLAIFLAWVFGGMYVSEDLFLRAFVGTMAGSFAMIFTFLWWNEL